MSKTNYHRHLPHQVPEGVPLFVTWNLKGALPEVAIEKIRRERERLEQQPARAGESSQARQIREAKLVFALADRFLESAADGPMYLRDPAAAKIVEDAILFGAGERYELFAWCVMSNHVHALVTPLWTLDKVMQGLKGYSAYRINAMQDARGRTLWQDESYDHWPRDEEELFRIIEYIENNPVAAQLCQRPQDWPWSSARLRDTWPRGQKYVGKPFQADGDQEKR